MQQKSGVLVGSRPIASLNYNCWLFQTTSPQELQIRLAHLNEVNDHLNHAVDEQAAPIRENPTTKTNHGIAGTCKIVDGVCAQKYT